jgi:hypothetical protein
MNRSKKTFRKSKKSNRSKKNKKTNLSKKHKKMGGGCGCDNNMHGGTSQYYYSLNNHNNDPNAPNNIIVSRQLPDLKGGRKRIRKMKGGMNGTSMLYTLTDPIFNTPSMTNPIMSYGNIAGGLSANNLLMGTPTVENTDTTKLSNINIENNAIV